MQDERRGLHCVGGKPAPPGLEEDVRLIRAFSGPLRTSLWPAVERILAEPVPAHANEVGRGLPIVTLTLVYDERGQRSAITLHALPTLLKKVRDSLSSIVA